jgi:hypothetical protein
MRGRNMKRTRITSGVMGFVFVIGGTGFLLGVSISNAQVPPLIEQKEIRSDNPGNSGPDNPTPPLPPTNDSEMVIKPDVPPDPDAIITPPVVDPEMAVDPSTRQPMTSEKLEQLTPEDSDRNPPDREKQRVPDR